MNNLRIDRRQTDLQNRVVYVDKGVDNLRRLESSPSAQRAAKEMEAAQAQPNYREERR